LLASAVGCGVETGVSAPGPSWAGGTGGAAPTGAGGTPARHQVPARATSCGNGRSRIWEGTFDRPDWLAHWASGTRFDFGDDHASIDDDPEVGKVLRIAYPAGAVASDSGAQFKAHIAGLPADGICLSYWLRFPEGFKFNMGGKLPGLCGGNCASGGAQTDGVSGWSMRYMWRTAYGSGQEYAYILPPNAYGTDLGRGAWSFVPGDWHHIVEELVLNTPGRADGVARVWYDRDTSEAPNFEKTDLTYRTVGSLRIDYLYFSTFFGGHEPAWAAPESSYADFALFELFQ
jgi:hypothetical protein